MEINTDIEKLFYLYTLEKPKYFEKIQKGFFKNPDLRILFEFSEKFFEKYKEPTSKDQVKKLITLTRYKDQIQPEVIDEAFNANLKEYDTEWLDESLKSWVKFKSLEDSLIRSIEYVKSNKIDTDTIDSVVEKVRSIVQDKNSISFDNSFGVNFANAAEHKFDASRRVNSGKVFFDRLSGGGYDYKTITVYAGEQNIGKCLIYDMKLKIRNKVTNKEQEISIGDLFEEIKNS